MPGAGLGTRRRSAISKVTVSKAGISASGTPRRSASCEGTAVLVSSAICIATNPSRRSRPRWPYSPRQSPLLSLRVVNTAVTGGGRLRPAAGNGSVPPNRPRASPGAKRSGIEPGPPSSRAGSPAGHATWEGRAHTVSASCQPSGFGQPAKPGSIAHTCANRLDQMAQQIILVTFGGCRMVSDLPSAVKVEWACFGSLVQDDADLPEPVRDPEFPDHVRIMASDVGYHDFGPNQGIPYVVGDLTGSRNFVGPVQTEFSG